MHIKEGQLSTPLLRLSLVFIRFLYVSNVTFEQRYSVPVIVINHKQEIYDMTNYNSHRFLINPKGLNTD